MATPITIQDTYAGYVLANIEIHKRLAETIEQITDETAPMYISMTYTFLCALNKMDLLDEVEQQFGYKFHALTGHQLKQAARFLFDIIGDPPEVNFD
jgi:hypothetical protein